MPWGCWIYYITVRKRTRTQSAAQIPKHAVLQTLSSNKLNSWRHAGFRVLRQLEMKQRFIVRKLDDGDNENDIRWRDGRVICSRCSRTNEISLSTMSQSVTSTKPNPFGPAVSECSLRSLKETDGSEPIICQLSARQIPSPHCFLSLFRCPSFLDSKFEQAVSEGEYSESI